MWPAANKLNGIAANQKARGILTIWSRILPGFGGSQALSFNSIKTTEKSLIGKHVTQMQQHPHTTSYRGQQRNVIRIHEGTNRKSANKATNARLSKRIQYRCKIVLDLTLHPVLHPNRRGKYSVPGDSGHLTCITVSTVVLNCCKGDRPSQWEYPIFGPL